MSAYWSSDAPGEVPPPPPPPPKCKRRRITLSFAFHGPALDHSISEVGPPPLPLIRLSKRTSRTNRMPPTYQTFSRFNEGAVAALTAAAFSRRHSSRLRARRRIAAADAAFGAGRSSCECGRTSEHQDARRMGCGPLLATASALNAAPRQMRSDLSPS